MRFFKIRDTDILPGLQTPSCHLIIQRNVKYRVLLRYIELLVAESLGFNLTPNPKIYLRT